MDLVDRTVLVTGGGGFVGSHLVEHLLELGNAVTIADDFSTGRREWVDDRATVIEIDLTDPNGIESVLDREYDLICHLAARSDANDAHPVDQFRTNTEPVHRLLRTAKDVGIQHVCFTSSSTVYGEAPIPTPEDYGPLEPISIYGASKLGAEGLLATYAHSYDFTVWNVRFANVVGARSRGTVIPDFIEKLCHTPDQLTILGDGRQEKSYLHVTDCVRAIQAVVEHDSSAGMHTYNLGTPSTTAVTDIAHTVADVLDLDPVFEFTGGERGWVGDVPRMRLDIERVQRLGWKPLYDSDEAVRQATIDLREEMDVEPTP